MKKLLFAVALALGAIGISVAQNQNIAPPSITPFQILSNTLPISASGSSASAAFSVSTTSTWMQVQVYNSASTTAFVAFGGSGVTASVGTPGTQNGSYPVAPGAVIVVTVPSSTTTYAAAILASGSGTVYFTPGFGI